MMGVDTVPQCDWIGIVFKCQVVMSVGVWRKTGFVQIAEICIYRVRT